jgi:hypothetical protein
MTGAGGRAARIIITCVRERFLKVFELDRYVFVLIEGSHRDATCTQVPAAADVCPDFCKYSCTDFCTLRAHRCRASVLSNQSQGGRFAMASGMSQFESMISSIPKKQLVRYNSACI